MNEQQRLVWLVTGCSTGLGRALAKTLLRRGQQVAATARDPAAIADIVAVAPDSALALALDVRNSAQIYAAVTEAERRFGTIDVLVNNAGHGLRAAVEEADESDVRDLFETNVFGLMAMTRAVLPIMRQRGRGHIVNITSTAGFIGNPGSGYYAATKFAVEGFSDSLAKEVLPLGVRVLVVAPGPFRTDFAGRSLKRSGVAMREYEGTAGKASAALAARNGRQAGDPQRAAEAIIAAVRSTNPPGHLLLGQSAVTRIREKLDEIRADIDAWEKVSLSADFPEESSRP
jgi:NAD(P)-dependent dehydrogenase (short-subunit alcohol dehydrogenase family)